MILYLVWHYYFALQYGVNRRWRWFIISKSQLLINWYSWRRIFLNQTLIVFSWSILCHVSPDEIIQWSMTWRINLIQQLSQIKISFLSRDFNVLLRNISWFTSLLSFSKLLHFLNISVDRTSVGRFMMRFNWIMYSPSSLASHRINFIWKIKWFQF